MTIYRRRFTHNEKIELISRHLNEGISISELARLNDIHPVTLYYWKRSMNGKNKKSDDINIKELLNEVNKLKNENKRLKKVVGEQVLDIDCLKDLNDFLKKKQQEEMLKKQKNSSEKIKITKKSE